MVNTELWSELPPEQWLEHEYALARTADLPLIVLSHGIEVAAAQVEIVPADAGAAVDLPRLPRLGVRRP